MAAPLPNNETERLKVLRHYRIMDSLPEDSFDDIVYLAAEICEVPVCLISFIDETRQWFKAKKGLEACETSRDLAFCAHTILNDKVLLIPDASKDARFYNNPLVLGEPYLRFYAGAPLLSPSRHQLGTLCVIDHQPRQLSAVQLNSLTILAKQVVKLLELRSRNQLLQEKLVLIQKQKDAITRFWYEREELLARIHSSN
jgi:GAF domain-containing protein